MKPPGLSLVWVMAIFALPILLSGCQSRQTSRQSVTGIYYTCSMHPKIHKAKPGNCPICSMSLIKVTPSVKTDKMASDSALSYLTEPVTQTVVGFFKIIEPVKGSPVDTITADGYIGFDQRDNNMVSTRVTGRIEKLYVRYTNQRIQKGQPLMKIYSPELLMAQRNLLQVIQDKDQTLIDPLKAQLINLGMQASELQRVIQNGEPLSSIVIYSPYDGISQQTSIGQSGMMMRTSNTIGDPTTELLNIREGMYINRGQTIFSIQNTDRIWAILNVFTSDIWHIHTGDIVNLYTDADKNNKIKGRVDFILPYHPQDEKTTRVRIYLPTGQAGLDHLPRNWKINTLIHGQISTSRQNKGVYIPLSAVNRLGTQSVIWVQDVQHPEIFHARKIKTGIETSDSIEITAGIQPGEKIAENAAYMVGSDSFIQ